MERSMRLQTLIRLPIMCTEQDSLETEIIMQMKGEAFEKE